jgi:hypothetical protein
VTDNFTRVIQALFDEGPPIRSDPFRTGLGTFAGDLDESPPFSAMGERMLRADLARTIRQRHAFEARLPSIEAPIGADNRGEAGDEGEAEFVFVVGLPRTGSTALHNLFALDDETTTVRLTEAMWPFPDPALSGGLNDPAVLTDIHLQVMDRLSPQLLATHPMRPDWPEECISLLQLTGMSQRLLYLAAAPRYARWLDTAPAATAYAELKQLVTHTNPTARRWVLKAPAHLPHLGLIEKIFRPRAFIWLHRDPAEVMASFCRLVLYIREPFGASGGHHTRALLGPEWLPRWTVWMNAALEDRAGLHTPVFDVSFDDISRTPVAAVNHLYAALGWTQPPSLASRAQTWLAQSRPSMGAPSAGLEDFGLTAADVADAYDHYLSTVPWISGWQRTTPTLAAEYGPSRRGAGS